MSEHYLLAGRRCRIEFNTGAGIAAVVGMFRAGDRAGDAWTVTDDGGAVHPVEVATITSAIPIGPRAASPELALIAEQMDQQALLAARERTAAASTLGELARSASAREAAAEEQRRAVFDRLREQEETATAERARLAALQESTAAAAAAERNTHFAQSSQERQLIMTRMEQLQRQAEQQQRATARQLQEQQQQAAQTQRTLAGLAETLTRLSERLDSVHRSPSPTNPIPAVPTGLSPMPSHERLPPPPPFASVGSAASTSAREEREEEMARAKMPIWSTHDLSARPRMEIYSHAQRGVLGRLPEMCLLRAEPDFDDLKIAIQVLADCALEIEVLTSAAAVEQHLRTLLRRGSGREEAAVTPERYVALQSSIALLSIPATRPRALFDVAAFALRLLPAFAKSSAKIDRLLVASLTVRPGSTKQVTKWTARQLPQGVSASECELTLANPGGLPVRSAGPALF